VAYLLSRVHKIGKLVNLKSRVFCLVDRNNVAAYEGIRVEELEELPNAIKHRQLDELQNINKLCKY
jgi:hypothetical protein